MARASDLLRALGRRLPALARTRQQRAHAGAGDEAVRSAGNVIRADATRCSCRATGGSTSRDRRRCGPTCSTDTQAVVDEGQWVDRPSAGLPVMYLFLGVELTGGTARDGQGCGGERGIGDDAARWRKRRNRTQLLRNLSGAFAPRLDRRFGEGGSAATGRDESAEGAEHRSGGAEAASRERERRATVCDRSAGRSFRA